MLQLEQQICFPVYALSRQITGCYRPLLEELNLTYPQYLVFLVLWEEQSISVKELGNKLFLDSGTLTPLLKRLEQRGLITRRRKMDDERVVMVTLTDAGQQLRQQARHIPEQLLEHINISEKQLKQLKESVNATLKALQHQ